MSAGHSPPPASGAGPGIDRVLTDLAQAARAAAGAQAAAVWLLDDGTCLALRAHDGLRHAKAVARVVPAEWFAATSAACSAADVANAPLAARAWMSAEGARKGFVTPLIVEDRVIGSLVVLLRGRAPARDALRRVAALAAGIAPILGTALAYAAMQARAERAEALLAITQTLAGTADLDAAVAEVARLAASALGAEHCAIVLAPPMATDAAAPDSLVVPITCGDTAIGTLTVTSPACAAWPPATVELVRAIAAQVALAADNARTHRHTRAQADELATLVDVGARLTSTLDLPSVLDAVAEAAVGLIGAQGCAVLELNAEEKRLHYRAGRGMHHNVTFSIPMGVGAAGTAAVRRTPVFSRDVERDPPPLSDVAVDQRGRTISEIAREHGYRAVLAVPLVSREQVLGAIAIFWNDVHERDEREVRLLTGLASQAAIALENARLYEDAQRALADLKAVQQRLVQGETLRAIGELAGGAAHHLNNLLTIVVGRVQLLLRTVEDERLSRPLEIVERAAKDGAEVVRRLQQFSRMREVTQTRRVDLNTVAADVLEMTRGHWHDAPRARGMSIEVQSRTGAVAGVAGDPAGLREAITNLVLNAVEAMPRGGRITIETASDGATVTLAVSDTGMGMREDVRLRAHEPFFTTKGVKATGLGLSVAYGIARRHGGELTIASTPGEGSTVTLRLPALAAAEPMPVTPPVPAGALKLHVLVVDDEREVCEALAEMLAAQGHTVITAGNGADAMEWVETEPALELVLTDLVMPGMTGWQVAEAVKARRPHVAVGVISGRRDATPVEDERRQAVDFFLDKPITLTALTEALTHVRPR
jgi:signal transduction histidine kinase/CheY-like chemotaxis protein